MISIIHPQSHIALVETDNGLVDSSLSMVFPKIRGAFRVVQGENYTDNFGLEWNTFQKTQIDKFSGSNITEQRFFAQTRWPRDMKGENILEVGSGAGRFSQIVLDHTQANLYSVDFSSAVEANHNNNGPHPRLKLFQASIYELPFAPASFDKVFCFGVLQHTPDVRKSVQSLINMLKPGGELVVDFYLLKGWYSKINAKYLLRPLVKNMDQHRMMKLIRATTPALLPVADFNRSIGLDTLNRFLPVCYANNQIAGLSKKEKIEWAVLDTFDMYSPTYDQPQTLETVAQWFKGFGMLNVDAQNIAYADGFSAATVKGTRSL